MRQRHRSLGLLGTAAAVGLVVSTLVPHPATAASTSTRLAGPLVTESSIIYGTPFSAPSVATPGTPLPANRSASLTAALAAATDWNIPGPGVTGPVFPVSRPDLCLTAGALDGDAVLRLCSDTPDQDFALAPNTGSNNPPGTGLRSAMNGGFLGTLNDDTTMRLQNQRTADRLASLDAMVPALSAVVRSTDTSSRSAVIDGFANAGADVVVAGAAPERASSTGAWSATVTGLRLGTNTVHVEQVEAGRVTGETDVPVTLAYAALTADHTFPSSRDQDVVASGTAEPGATVEIRDTADTLVASAAADAASGRWSTAVPAPDRGGEYRTHVGQRIGGDLVDDVPLVIDYGRAVSVSDPADGSDEDPGPLTMTGTGDASGAVTVREDQQVIGSTEVGPTGVWRLTTSVDLDARRHELDVEQVAKGNNTTRTTITLNPDGGTVPAPTAEVHFDADVTRKATVSGTGAEGAVIELFVGSDRIGRARVSGGVWSVPIDPIGPGDHRIRVHQTLDDDARDIEVTADYGAAARFVTADGIRFSDGRLTVSGVSSTGADVTIVTGGKRVDRFTVQAADGTFTRDLRDIGSGPIDLAMTASSRGGLVTTDDLRAVSAPRVEDITVTSHSRGSTFVPGAQVFSGRATAGTTVTMNPFGFADRYSSYDLTAPVDQFGVWRVERGLANTPYLKISFAQTPQDGVVNELLDYGLTPYREIGAPADLTLTTFRNGDFFTPGPQTFSGTATPGATVTLNPFGFDPRYRAYDITTTASLTTGAWSIPRGLSGTVYREVAVRQDPTDPDTVNSIEHVTLAPNGWVGPAADLVLRSPGTSFTPGVQTFTGTATPGTTVTLYPFGDDRYAGINTTTTANAIGTWRITRTLGNQVFPIVITQTPQSGRTNRITHTMVPRS